MLNIFRCMIETKKQLASHLTECFFNVRIIEIGRVSIQEEVVFRSDGP